MGTGYVKKLGTYCSVDTVKWQLFGISNFNLMGQQQTNEARTEAHKGNILSEHVKFLSKEGIFYSATKDSQLHWT
jgi:hypothetical protein